MLELNPFPSTFPLETEENIIDELSDCVPTLRHCALTCRAWLPRSRVYLLRSVRIKSGQQLEAFSDMLDTYPHRRSWLDSVTMAPEYKESNPRRLIEAFPAALLANTPKLRSWAITQASREVAARDTLFFHNTTFIRLRYCLIEELHLCSVRLGSHAELIRLVMAFGRLGNLKCTSVRFSKVDAGDISVDIWAGISAGISGVSNSLKTIARRRLTKLSGLHMRNMELKVIELLLEVTQNSLQRFDVFRIKGTSWEDIPLPPKLKTVNFNPMSPLTSITLHWRNKQNSGLEEYLEGVFRSISRLTSDHLCGAPNLETIGIQLHFHCSPHPQSSLLTSGRLPTLTLAHVLEKKKALCVDLERALVNLRLVQYIFSLRLPSEWMRNETILRRPIEENLPRLHEKGQLAIEICGGTLPPTGAGHDCPVFALKVSPDAKWIASGSKDDSIILWDAEHPGWAAAQWRGCASSSQSLAFSPDSRCLAFPAPNHTGLEVFHVRRVEVQGILLATLSMPHHRTLTFWPERHCAWSPDGTKLSAAVFYEGDTLWAFACVWDTATYAVLHVITDHPTLYVDAYSDFPFGAQTASLLSPPPLVNCFLDGGWLVVVWFPQILPDSHPEGVPLRPPSHIWDLATGARCSAREVEEHEQRPAEWNRQQSCSITLVPGQNKLITSCGDDVRDWTLMAYGRYRSPRCVEERVCPLSPDGRRRLSWSTSESSFTISDAHTGRRIAAFSCANVVGGCFSPDGQCVAVCSEDGTGSGWLQVGMVSDGTLVGGFPYKCYPEGSRIQNYRVVAFSADGGAVYLGAPSGVVRVFPLSLPDLRGPAGAATRDGDAVRWRKWEVVEDSDNEAK